MDKKIIKSNNLKENKMCHLSMNLKAKTAIKIGDGTYIFFKKYENGRLKVSLSSENDVKIYLTAK